MEHDPIKNDARRQRRANRLGPEPKCAFCGVKDPEALTVVRRTMLEAHHAVLKANDEELTITVCLNCHRCLQEGLKDGGVEGRTPETFLHRLYNILANLATFFVALGEKLWEWARRLLTFIKQLDNYCPDWRSACAEVA